MMSVDQIDTAFEFWLTISFGVLIAVHIARESITKPLKLAMSLLYVTASTILILHTIGDMLQVIEYRRYLGSDSPGQTPNTIAGVLRLFLYFVGTIGIAIAIFRYNQWMASNDT